MSELRCPRCGAVRRAGDQWCGLCYADFREPPPTVVGDATQAPPPPPDASAAPPPAAGSTGPPLIRPPDHPGAVPPPAPPGPAQPAPPAPAAIPSQTSGPFVPSTSPLAPAAVLPSQAPQGVAPTEPAVAGEEPAVDATWPCPRCGIDVSISEDFCPACGAGFLEGAGSGGNVSVPLIGDIRRINSGQKLMLGAAVAAGILIGILILFTIGGAIFH